MPPCSVPIYEHNPALAQCLGLPPFRGIRICNRYLFEKYMFIFYPSRGEYTIPAPAAPYLDSLREFKAQML